MSYSEQSNKRKKAKSCSEITTRKIFEEFFPRIRISAGDQLKPRIWNFEGSEDIIFQWLHATSVNIASTSKLIRMENEHGLYPLVLNLVQPIVALANGLVIRSTQSPQDSDVIEAACEAFAANRSRESSSRSSLASLSAEPAAAAAEEMEKDDTFLPDLIDATNFQQLAGLYIAIEKLLRSEEFTNKGRVELAVVDAVSNAIKLLVEVKHSMRTDAQKGLWQTCAEMAIASESTSASIAGVYTDYTYWTFLFYDARASCISKSRTYTLALESGCFTYEAYEIFRFLFEMLDVSPEVSITDSLSRVQALNESLAQMMMADLEKDRSGKRALEELSRIAKKQSRVAKEQSWMAEEQIKRANVAEQKLAELLNSK
jgi:hypothetical protein